MENNESNLKPQQTGGLKLMTVFIAVLALHVLVIGGFTVYHLMSGGSSEADLVTDKAHKSVKVSSEGALATDGQLPDGSADKNTTTTSTAPADVKGAPMTIPANDSTASSDASSTAASATTTAANNATPPAPASTPDVASSAPAAPVPSGPVITPPATAAPAPTSAPDASSEDATASAPAPETDLSGGIPYVVRPHDSLARIAHHHHITVAKLREANGLKTDMLRIGQKLTIPGKSEVAESASAITPEGNATILSDSAPAPVLKKKGTAHEENLMARASGSRHLYTVMKGDTLTKIAHKFRTTAHALMAANGISDARRMKIGQKLRIPSQESRSAANTTHAPSVQPDRIQPRATPSAQLANFVP